MDEKKFYRMLDEILGLDLGTINGNESLSNAGLFDSLSMLGLISLLDMDFGIQTEPNKIIKIGTIFDLFQMVRIKDFSAF